MIRMVFTLIISCFLFLPLSAVMFKVMKFSRMITLILRRMESHWHKWFVFVWNSWYSISYLILLHCINKTRNSPKRYQWYIAWCNSNSTNQPFQKVHKTLSPFFQFSYIWTNKIENGDFSFATVLFVQSNNNLELKREETVMQ